MNNIACLNIKEADESLFNKKYVLHCLDCSFCDDACCSYGCPVDLVEVERILHYADQLEAELGIPSSQWFKDESDMDKNYPSGEVKNTRVYNGKCVFYKDGPRGCSLQRLCIEVGMDTHQLKPMVCCLFPVAWENKRLYVSGFLDELPCGENGISVFEAQKNELRIYLGEDFVADLERSQCK